MNFRSITLSGGLLILLPTAACGALFTSGHADVFAIGYEGGELEPHIHAEGAIIDGSLVADGEFDPSVITTVVPQSTADYWTGVGGTPNASWSPVGVGVGESFWFLPQSNSGPAGAATLGAPFAGIGTEELNALDWTTPISISLESVSGPGHFSMYLDGLSPIFAMSSFGGIDGSDVINIAAGGHEHYNWAFSAPGTYDIEVLVSGTHITDGAKQATATYQFLVVPEPSTTLFGLISAGLLFRRRR